MNPLKKIQRKYKISNEDTKLLMEILVSNIIKEAEVDGVIYHKYKEITRNHCIANVDKHPKTKLRYETIIQEWAMLYLESLEKELNKQL
jgi:hypothetical protein